MHDFKFLGNNLFCEKVPVTNLARKFGTPLYVYSFRTMVEHFRKLKDAFVHFRPLICYSLKANSNLALAKILVNQGAGLDIVSGGELFKALRIGIDPKKIVYASVGKTETEIAKAIKSDILFFNAESVSELRTINRIAGSLEKTARVAIRINPDIEPKTHKYITTGKLTNKFGLSLSDAFDIFLDRDNFSNLSINGVHMHIGSQIIESSPFIGAIRRIVAFIERLNKVGIVIEYLNIGGGLGIIYNRENPQTAAEFAKNISPLLRKTKLKIILEPGRFIVGNAGILVTKVIYVKKSHAKTFAIVDAGMNDLIRPSLYGAFHNIVSLQRKIGPQKTLDIVGPICESADFFAKNRKMPPIEEGDLLAIMGTGAYGFSMASNYNSRLRPAEVLVKGAHYYLIRERESLTDLVRLEHIPNFLN
ncbi:MAG: diaminopimelate decarboxylase [Candidatus Omnitrophota bacterium]